MLHYFFFLKLSKHWHANCYSCFLYFVHYYFQSLLFATLQWTAHSSTILAFPFTFTLTLNYSYVHKNTLIHSFIHTYLFTCCCPFYTTFAYFFTFDSMFRFNFHTFMLGFVSLLFTWSLCLSFFLENVLLSVCTHTHVLCPT